MTTAVLTQKQSAEQISFGGNDNPNDFLEIGKHYDVYAIEVHSWHIKLLLLDYPGKKFNLINFDIHPPEAIDKAIKNWEDHN